MKSILIATTILFINVTSNASDLGKTLDLEVDPSTGNYQLGVHYAYDAGVMGDKFNLSWSMLFGTKTTNQELATLPAQIKWNLFNNKTNKFLDDWANRPTISGNDLKLGNVGVESDLAKQVIGNQSSISIVFATTEGSPLYNLNVGQFCKSLPTYFVNLTDTSKRCDAVTVAEIDAAQKDFCNDSAEELFKYVKDGLITCEAARKTYLGKGCGELSCK